VFTKNLSEAERFSPDIVFTDFFNFIHLDEAREELQIRIGLLKEMNKEKAENEIEIENSVLFYEKLIKVLEAAWLLH
jgi:hypothetical protein